MTRPDNDELKRLAEGATPGEWRVSEDNNPFAGGRHVFAKGLDGTDFVVLNLKTDQTFVTATSKVQQQRNAKFSAAANPAVVLALLSEIEGLKAERDAWKKAVAAAQNADAENDAHLRSLLRTQAPDSWRPDRCDVEETIHAWLRDHAGNAIKMTMTPTIRDALADAILALRPQTAESGK